ncbi:MAG TPA: PadR family transcriptional regulator [Propionibacteriaceae bacterium]|nr:PadR family transcriptional regulator [Propionibacteriaceae bacterium]
MSEHPETTYAVLGLVDKLPGSSGYELAGVAANSLAFFWPVSRTLLYRELTRLSAMGWVEPTRVEQTHAPSKWTYRTTSDGQRALSDWLATPPDSAGSERNPVLLRLFFSYRLPPEQARSLLSGYRDRLEMQRDQLNAISEKLSATATPQARAGWLAARHGVLTIEAALLWVDEAEAFLAEAPW